MYAIYTTDTVTSSPTVVATQILFYLLPLKHQGFSLLALPLLICDPFCHHFGLIFSTFFSMLSSSHMGPGHKSK